MKWLRGLFDQDKIDEMQKTIDIYKERNSQLEKYVKRAKDAELKVKCMQMYIDDDEAILELLEETKKKDIIQSQSNQQEYLRARAASQGQGGQIGGVSGNVGLSRFLGGY